jgi:predicted amidohydrolase YtcJ
VFHAGPPGVARAIGSEEGPAPAGAPTAVAIAGDRIFAVGTDDVLAARRGPRTDVFDARGGMISAGFDDAHIHFKMGAMALVGVQLRREASVAEMQSEIRRYAAEHRDDEWIRGRGWHYNVFPGGMPIREQLDEVVPDRPALIDSFDAHSAWVNSRALAIAGITRDTPDPSGGEIVRDPATGEPTGALKEMTAVDLVEQHAPLPSEEEQLTGMREALRQYAAQGLTAAQDAAAEPDQFELYARLLANDELTARVRLALEMEPGLSGSQWETRLAEFEGISFPRRGNPWLAGGILKGFTDGVVESGTAYLLEPYADREGRGRPNWSDGELAQTVAVAHRRGWQVKLHAIGDGSVRQALDAYEQLGDGEARSRRHRLEHIETIAADDLSRPARLGVVASMQPYHSDPAPAELAMWSRALGTDRASRGWPMGSLHTSGAVLAFGSDWPVRSFEPFLALHAAVNRTTIEGVPPGGWLPAERLSLPDALSAYTWGSAYAAHEESRRGVAFPGHFADLAVLDRDLLAEGASAITGTRVTLTVVGGRIVHRSI